MSGQGSDRTSSEASETPVAEAIQRLKTGKRYSVAYKCRDIGYGAEEGEDVFTFFGRGVAGKLTFEPTNGGPPIYLFDDEVTDLEVASEARRTAILNARATYLAVAKERFAYDDDVSIDDDAAVSEADSGAWVAAWVWIADES